MNDAPDRFTVDFTGLTLLGQYQVDEKLADGGMGAVYLATDTNLGQRVAVKVPHPRFLGEPGFRERFAAEVEELVRLEHPHVARILARGEHDQVPFFVLQFLGGGNLEDRIGAGRMTPVEVLAWLRTAAETLDFVHARGIVHRDVKPANILFNREGHLFISDFGVAKAIHADTANLTATGMGIGSPKYMAPEQGAGGGVGPAADQYGLASAVYEALGGEPPFGSGDPLRVLVKKQQEPPRPIGELAPGVPKTAADAVMRALAKDPKERFATCTEFAEAFAAGISTTTMSLIEADPGDEPGGVKVGVSLSGTKALLFVGAIVGVLALAVAGFVLLTFPFSSDDPVPPAPVGGSGDSRTFVDLFQPGAEPRKPLRYRLAEGAQERMRLTWLAEMRFALDDEEMQSSGAIPMVFDSDVQIDSVESSGAIRYHSTLVDCRLPMSEGEEVDPAVGQLVEHLKSLVGLVARGRLDSRGADHKLQFEGVEEKGAAAQHFLTGISEGLRRLCVPMPVEEVGVGAKWDVTEMLSMGGMRFTGTTRYELISMEGWRIRVRYSSAVLALGQDVFPPGFEGAGEFKSKSHNATSEGEILIDLTQLVPQSSKARDEMNMEGTLTREGETRVFRMRNLVNTTLERR